MSIIDNRDQNSILRTAKKGCRDWGLSEDLDKVGNCENIIFKSVDDAGKRAVVRVTEPVHRSADELEQELQFLSHLVENNLPVVRPRKAQSGDSFVISYTDEETNNVYHVSVFDFAEGKPFSLEKHWNFDFARTLGKAVAGLKTASQSFSKKYPDIKRYSFFDIKHVKEALQHIPAEQEAARKEWALGIEWFQSLKQTPENFGLVHADIHYRNLHIEDDGSICVFDFDDVCQNFFLYDLMMPWKSAIGDVEGFLNASNPSAEEFQDVLLESYAGELGIQNVKALKTAMEQFSRFREIEMVAWKYMMEGAHGRSEEKQALLQVALDGMRPDEPFEDISEALSF